MMVMGRTSIHAITIAMIIAGCGGPATKEKPQATGQESPAIEQKLQDSHLFAASFDRVWNAVVATISEMDYPVESMERENGSVTTKSVDVAGKPAAKGLDRISTMPSIANGVWSRGWYSLSIFVTPGGKNRTNVRITTHIEGYESKVSDGWHICYSNGFLEKQFFSSVESKLARK
jgi:hypothetical protein